MVYPLSKIIFREFIKAALMPLLFIELALVLLYFAINSYTHNHAVATLKKESVSHLQEIVGTETRILSQELRTIAELGRIVQGEAVNFFHDLPTIDIQASAYSQYRFADNGVYYKIHNTGGGSLFYSAASKVGEKKKRKAIASERLDPVYKLVKQANDSIAAVYLNTYDSMNRYYPFIPEVYSQFVPDMNIPKFNFYYLADAQHNPSRSTVWTETYLDPAGQGWMMSCIAPVYTGDFLEGVTGIDITIDKFLQNILKMDLPWGAQPFLVDATGTIMAMPQAVEKIFQLTELRSHVYKDRVARDTFKPREFNLQKTALPGIPDLIARILAEKKGVVELTLNDRQYLLAHATEEETGWKLMVLADNQKILAQVAEMDRQAKALGYAAISGMVLFYCLFILYLLFNARRIAGQISSPVVKFARRSTQIAKGNYDAAPIESQVLELVVLNDNYTAMVEEIKKLNGELRAEIAKANKEIEERKLIEAALRESEHQLVKARDNAEAASRAKSVFLANISHELRTPLHHIIGFSELLVDQGFGPLNERQQTYVKNVLKSSNTLLTLIDEVLEMAGVAGEEHE